MNRQSRLRVQESYERVVEEQRNEKNTDRGLQANAGTSWPNRPRFRNYRRHSIRLIGVRFRVKASVRVGGLIVASDLLRNCKST